MTVWFGLVRRAKGGQRGRRLRITATRASTQFRCCCCAAAAAAAMQACPLSHRHLPCCCSGYDLVEFAAAGAAVAAGLELAPSAQREAAAYLADTLSPAELAKAEVRTSHCLHVYRIAACSCSNSTLLPDYLQRRPLALYIAAPCLHLQCTKLAAGHASCPVALATRCTLATSSSDSGRTGTAMQRLILIPALFPVTCRCTLETSSGGSTPRTRPGT